MCRKKVEVETEPPNKHGDDVLTFDKRKIRQVIAPPVKLEREHQVMRGHQIITTSTLSVKKIKEKRGLFFFFPKNVVIFF